MYELSQGYPCRALRSPDPATHIIFFSRCQIIDIDRRRQIATLGGSMDVNTAILVYLRDRYAEANGDLTTLLTRYLNTEVTAPTATARFHVLIAAATA